ncbi:beta-propeller fold lactonase family protein [Faecalicatena contorta]|uniref:beta-propeller fold lactonase family protein n=1 Tax=Faecalicatena contorta TaxID=39482 RepID=UPI0018972901|nr:beta-propeller fold lactonase family protein [Faecalicatena contorta]
MEKKREKETTAGFTDGYVGTYYSEESRGIYRFSFHEETGELTAPELFYEARNSKWISLNNDRMVIPDEKAGKAGTCFLELNHGSVKKCDGEVLQEHQTPCYIEQEEDFIYTANYHEGTVMIYQTTEEKPEVVKRIKNGEGAGCHQILLHDSYIMVPCLTQDRIRLFDKEKGFAPAGEISFPKGSGPRHGVFNQAHTRLYVVSEWSNELFIFKVCGREFLLDQTFSVLPQNEKTGERPRAAAAAAIRLTKDEKFLYISVRERELLAVIDVSHDKATVIQHVSCGGKHPRDFILSKNEKFLLVANRLEGGIVCIERDCDTGKLKGVRSRIEMPEGVSLVLA